MLVVVNEALGRIMYQIETNWWVVLIAAIAALNKVISNYRNLFAVCAILRFRVTPPKSNCGTPGRPQIFIRGCNLVDLTHQSH